jgi:hypothetical protein
MTTTDTGALRCSDAERETVCARLHAAAGEGRLTIDEAEERLTAVYAARHRHELDALIADLPAPAVPTAGWRAVFAQLWAQLAAELAVLLGRSSAASKRRRILTALAVVGVLILIGGLAALVINGIFDGGDHHGFDAQQLEH